MLGLRCLRLVPLWQKLHREVLGQEAVVVAFWWCCGWMMLTMLLGLDCSKMLALPLLLILRLLLGLACQWVRRDTVARLLLQTP